MNKNFTHECSDCKYYGSLDGYDIYICFNSNNILLNTILIRYGEEDREYYSCSFEDIFSGSLTKYRLAAHSILKNDPLYKLVQKYCELKYFKEITKDYIFSISCEINKNDSFGASKIISDWMDIAYYKV